MKLSRSLLILSLLVASCTFGPDYQNPPSVEMEAAWKSAGFSAPAPAGSWWTLFGDPKLNAYMSQATNSTRTATSGRNHALSNWLAIGRTVTLQYR